VANATVSYSLPAELAEWVRRQAKAQGVPASAVVAEVLRRAWVAEGARRRLRWLAEDSEAGAELAGFRAATGGLRADAAEGAA
jgi:post-segregation antitoxin (ccd killing protein)